MIKATMVSNMLAPYRVSFYNALALKASFHLILDTISEFNRNWNLPNDLRHFPIILQNCRSFVYRRKRSDVGYEEKRQFQFSEQTYAKLSDLRPDVIVTIEYGFKTLWSLLYGRIHDVPVILASEGTMHTEGHVGLLKRLVRKGIVSQCSRFWSNGPDSTKLLLSYGALRESVDEGMTGIDTDDLRDAVRAHLLHRDQIREQWGLRGRVLLFSGSLSPRKGVILLAEAVEQWFRQGAGSEFTLLLLGDGEHREWLENWAKRNPEIRLVMPGFVQPQELPPFFAAADWAVLPTVDDNWPLATLETLVAGLPQLFSCYNGATTDLCTADTGVAFDPRDQESFVTALRRMAASPERRIPEEIVQQFSAYFSAESQALRAMESFRKAILANGGE
jgi:glycosyltransferase involved in cell wall biosynthesis